MRPLALTLALAILCTRSAWAQETIAQVTVEPATVTLTHADARQHLLVSAKLADGSYRDLTRSAQYASAHPAIAGVTAAGVVAPRGTGETVIQITLPGGGTTRVAVKVAAAAPRPVSFSTDVMPIFAKAGCNSGACHGAASGKKGFKVSLRGYDAAADFITLTRGSEARRLNFHNPDASLLLLKPTAQVVHDGGKRFDARSDYAATLRRWIAEGAKSDTTIAPTLTGLEIYPKFRTFPTPGLEQQLLVMASFSDGSVRDVTTDARYSSSNESAADVSEAGIVRMPNKGEAAVIARYGPMLAVGTVVVLKHDPAFLWNNPAENNYIDKLVHAKLQQLEYLPSEVTSDEEFLRRVYYDVIGVPPTPMEIRAFLADKSPTSAEDDRHAARTSRACRVLGPEVGRSAQAAFRPASRQGHLGHVSLAATAWPATSASTSWYAR